MTSKYLLDTNIVLRLSNRSDSQHKLATEAVATLLRQGNECYLTAQVLIELWVVATRPIKVKGCVIVEQKNLTWKLPIIKIMLWVGANGRSPLQILGAF